jgi:hypothetical protein
MHEHASTTSSQSSLDRMVKCVALMTNFQRTRWKLFFALVFEKIAAYNCCHILTRSVFCVNVKNVKNSLYRSRQSLRIPGGWGPQISKPSAHEDGNVVSTRYRNPLPLWSNTSTHFCYRLSQPQGYSKAERIKLMKNSSDTVGNRNRYILACRSVPQSTLFSVQGLLKSIFLSVCTSYTGRFIMFSVITNTYNNKPKGPTLIELFTATRKLFQFSCGCEQFH